MLVRALGSRLAARRCFSLPIVATSWKRRTRSSRRRCSRTRHDPARGSWRAPARWWGGSNCSGTQVTHRKTGAPVQRAIKPAIGTSCCVTPVQTWSEVRSYRSRGKGHAHRDDRIQGTSHDYEARSRRVGPPTGRPDDLDVGDGAVVGRVRRVPQGGDRRGADVDAGVVLRISTRTPHVRQRLPRACSLAASRAKSTWFCCPPSSPRSSTSSTASTPTTASAFASSSRRCSTRGASGSSMTRRFAVHGRCARRRPSTLWTPTRSKTHGTTGSAWRGSTATSSAWGRTGCR